MNESIENVRLQSAIKECWQSWHSSSRRGGRSRVRFHEPTHGPEEIWAAVRCLLTGQVSIGDAVRRFEEEFAARFGFDHAVMVNSGSSANLLAVAALCNPKVLDGLHPGNEVIVPALCGPTTVWPLIQHGLVPVFVDVDPESWTIDPLQVKEALSPRTRAIFPVHVHGNPCDMRALGRIAQEHSLILLEDCRAALGATFEGKAVGNLSRVATFSFRDEPISTIEGGMCVTNDFEVAEVLRSLRAHGGVRDNIDPGRHWRGHPDLDPQYLFVSAGYNLCPTELQGAIGSVQLAKLDEYVRLRRDTASWWKKECEPWREVLELQKEVPSGESSWLGLPIGIREEAPFQSKDLRAHLEACGVETRPVLSGNLASQPILKSYPHRLVGGLGTANSVTRRAFVVGNHQGVDAETKGYVARRFREFVSGRRPFLATS